jgi:DNA-binding transcriptional ArsR family regulator
MEINIVCRALSSSIRVKMLFLLAEKDYCACKFPDLLGISQPNSSRNLDVLRKAGLVTSYRDGQKIIYQLKHKEIISMMEQIKKI